MLLIMPDQMGIGFVCSILHPTSKEKVLCNLATLYRYIDQEHPFGAEYRRVGSSFKSRTDFVTFHTICLN